MNLPLRGGTAALSFLTLVLSNVSAAPVSFDLSYNPVPGHGDSSFEMTAYFDDAVITGSGVEVVPLTSLDVRITSVRMGLDGTFFHLPNTDPDGSCRVFSGVGCFDSTPYTVTLKNGGAPYLRGNQGLGSWLKYADGGTSAYVNSILFQLGFNPANSYGPLASVRYLNVHERVHDSLLTSTGAIRSAA